MTVIFYNNNSDKRVLNKNILEVKSVSAIAKGDIDIISPTLILQYTDMTNINYCYISDLKRYYFIKNIRYISGQRIEIDMNIDVLMTYSENINKLTVNVLRYENISPTYLYDSRIPLFSDTTQKVIEFPDNIFNLSAPKENDKNFLLNVSGGDLK